MSSSLGRENIRIENACVANIGRVAAIWIAANNARRRRQDANEAKNVEQLIRGRMNGSDALFVLAKRADDIVGIGHQLPAREDDGAGPAFVPGLMHLSMVAVEPELWGHGVGKAITSYLIERATERGYDVIQLWTHVSNERAQRLYECLGFLAAGREKTDNRGERIKLYRRTLR